MVESKLRDVQVNAARPAISKRTGEMVPHRIGDGGGLWLVAETDGNKRWVYRFSCPLTRRVREMGLGSLTVVSLKAARQRRNDMRTKVLAGVNPIVERREAKAAKLMEVAAVMTTFEVVMERVIAVKRRGWRSAKHQAEYRLSLQTYAASLLSMPVASICKHDIIVALTAKVAKGREKAGQSFWTAKPETASRVLQRIETVLDAATALDLRKGDNPARWKGHLEFLLSSKKATPVPHAAMASDHIPVFFVQLAEDRSMPALALQFLILTAARSSEVYGARWTEIDFVRGIWTVPASRMKAGLEHLVPLSRAAISVLADAKNLRAAELVFPGRKKNPLGASRMRNVIKLLGSEGVTVHGMRSSFRDWCGDVADVDREIAEMSLAHTIGTAVERAYRRRRAFEKRRLVMEAWSHYCLPAGDAMVANNA